MKRLLTLFLLCMTAYAADLNQTDLFVVLGTNLMTTPRESYTIGLGHKFKKIRRTEVAAIYSYGITSQSESLSLARTIHLPGRYTSFASVNGGMTKYELKTDPLTTFANATYGVGMHIHYHYTLSVSETGTWTDYRPLYWTTSVGLTHGWWFVSVNQNRDHEGDRESKISVGISLSALANGEHRDHPRVIHTN